MTKIDESKKYKFSEIIAMLENEELPIGTCVFNPQGDNYNVKKSTVNYFGLAKKQHIPVQAIISAKDINDLWTITLPKEDKFYLKAPGAFKSSYLNLHIPNDHYFLSDNCGSEMYQTQFTQKEIDSMTFDTTFFGEPIKVEQADE